MVQKFKAIGFILCLGILVSTCQAQNLKDGLHMPDDPKLGEAAGQLFHFSHAADDSARPTLKLETKLPDGFPVNIYIEEFKSADKALLNVKARDMVEGSLSGQKLGAPSYVRLFGWGENIPAVMPSHGWGVGGLLVVRGKCVISIRAFKRWGHRREHGWVDGITMAPKSDAKPIERIAQGVLTMLDSLHR